MIYSIKLYITKLLSVLIVFIFVIISFPSVAKKPELYFSGASFNYKLNDTKIWCFEQDEQGFLYFGGENGLYRYDSYQLINHISDITKSNSLSNNRVFSLFVDQTNIFWIGTGRGLNIFDSHNNQFYNFKNSGYYNCLNSCKGHIESIIQGQKSDIWFIDTELGLGHITKTDKPAEFFNYKEKTYKVNLEYSSCLIGPDGTVWVGTNMGLFKLVPNSKMIEKVLVPTNTELNIIKLFYKNDVLWIGSFSGLWKYDIKNKTYLQFEGGYKNIKKPSENTITGIIEFKNGLLLAVDGGGINYFEESTGNFYEYNSKNEALLNCNNITSLFKDKNGSIWAGTYMHGVNICNISTMFSPLVRNKIFGSTERCVINGFKKTSNGDIWVVTDRAGIFLKYKNSDEYFKINIPNNLVDIDNIAATDLQVVNDEIWISTWGKGIVIIDKNKKVRIIDNKNSGLNSSKLKCLIYDSLNSKMWVGHFGFGINSYDLKTKKWTSYVKDINDKHSISSNWINGIFIDSKNDFWAYTVNGLNKFDKQLNKFVRYSFVSKDADPNYNFLNDIIQLNDSTLLLATNGSGIVKLNRKNPQKYLIYLDFLKKSEQNIKSLIKDDNGEIWYCTQHSINKFENLNFQKAIHYKTNNDQDALVFNNAVKYKDDKGRLYFGTNNGFLIVNTKNYTKNLTSPPVVITQLSVLQDESSNYNIDSLKFKKIDINVPYVELEHNQNNIVISFAALNYISSSNNTYKYMLEGAENIWHIENYPKPASYHNLRPGKYKFKVYASNNDGIWNEIGSVIFIKIKSPWYGSWWFITLVILVFALIITFVIKERIDFYKSQKIQLMEMVNNRTLELNSANVNLETMLYRISHDLQEPVKSLLGLVKVGDIEFEKDSKFKVYLNHLSGSANKLNKLVTELTLLSNSSFLIGKEKINFDEIISEIKLAINNEADSRNFEITLINNLKTEFLSEKKVIYTILFNMIHNALVFRDINKKISFVDVKISDDSEMIKIEFSDNGVGIEQKEISKIFEMFYRGSNISKGTGMGLFVVKAMVNRLNGRIAVTSAVDVGTEFVIELPLQ